MPLIIAFFLKKFNSCYTEKYNIMPQKSFYDPGKKPYEENLTDGPFGDFGR